MLLHVEHADSLDLILAAKEVMDKHQKDFRCIEIQVAACFVLLLTKIATVHQPEIRHQNASELIKSTLLPPLLASYCPFSALGLMCIPTLEALNLWSWFFALVNIMYVHCEHILQLGTHLIESVMHQFIHYLALPDHVYDFMTSIIIIFPT